MIYRLQSGNDAAVCEEHDTAELADCSQTEEISPGSGTTLTVLQETQTEKAPSGIIKTISCRHGYRYMFRMNLICYIFD